MMWWLWCLVVLVVMVLWIRVAFRPEITACFERDPAARSSVEIILTYAGLHALVSHRIAQRGQQLVLKPRVAPQPGTETQAPKTAPGQ